MADNTAPPRPKSKSSIRRLVRRVSSMTLRLRSGKRNSHSTHTSDEQPEAAPEPVQSPCIESTAIPDAPPVEDNATAVLENSGDQTQEGLTDREHSICQNQPSAEVEVQKAPVEVDNTAFVGAGPAEQSVLAEPKYGVSMDSLRIFDSSAKSMEEDMVAAPVPVRNGRTNYPPCAMHRASKPFVADDRIPYTPSAEIEDADSTTPLENQAPEFATQEPSLMGLPFEVRRTILGYILRTDRNRHTSWPLAQLTSHDFGQLAGRMTTANVTFTSLHDDTRGLIQVFEPKNVGYNLDASVLRASERLYHEGRTVLCTDNKWLACSGFGKEVTRALRILGLKDVWQVTASQLGNTAFYKPLVGKTKLKIDIQLVKHQNMRCNDDTLLIPLSDLPMAVEAIYRDLCRRSTVIATSKISVQVRKRLRMPKAVSVRRQMACEVVNDVIWPWVGEWIDSVRACDDILSGIKELRFNHNALLMTGVRVLGRLNVREHAAIQLDSLSDVLTTVETALQSNKTPELERTLMSVFNQACDAYEALGTSLLAPSDPASLEAQLQRLLAIVAWHVAFFDMDPLSASMPSSEWTGFRRHQLLFAVKASRLRIRAEGQRVWNIHLMLRMANLCHELGDTDNANEYLHQAVTWSDRGALGGARGYSLAMKSIRDALAASVGTGAASRMLCWRQMVPRDVPLVASIWAESAGYAVRPSVSFSENRW